MRERERQTDRQTDTVTVRERERQTDRQTDRHSQPARQSLDINIHLVKQAGEGGGGGRGGGGEALKKIVYMCLRGQGQKTQMRRRRRGSLKCSTV